jgi:hypothetical protein
VKPRQVLYVLVILAVVLGGVFYLEDRVEQQAELKQEQSRLISLDDPADVRSLEISGQKVDSAIKIARKDDKPEWDLTAPVKGKADNLSVERLINGLKQAMSEQRLTGKSDLASYGLDPAQYRITLTDKKGTAHTVLVGEQSPTQGFVYLAPGDKSEVWLVKADVRPALTQSLFDFRDKSALDFVVAKVGRLEMTQGQGKEPLVLERTKSGDKEAWQMADGQRADPEAVSDLLFQVSGLRVIEFIDKPLDDEKTGLAAPTAVYSLTMEDGAGEALLIGGPKEGNSNQFHARRRSGGPVMMLTKASLDRLKHEPKDFVYRKVFEFDRDEVVKLEVQRPDGKLVFAKQDGKWRRQEPKGDDKSGEPADLFMWDLGNLKWEKLLPAQGAYGLDKPVIELILTLKKPLAGGGGEDSARTVKLLIGEKDKESGLIPAQVVGRENIMGLGADFMDSIPKSPAKDDKTAESPAKE